VEVPEGVWPPPSLTVPIFSRLKSIIAHPFYVVWVLDSLLLDRKASQNLTNIGISSECSRNPATFNYALFDYTLERVAAFSTGKIKLMLSFAFTSDGGDINDWVEKHLALTNDASKSSIISRLNNVASLVVSSFWHVSYDSKMIEMLPDWLGMFPNLTAIEFVDQPQENVRKLEEKEFVRKVAISCRKVGFLGVRGRKLRLDKVRRDVKIKMNVEGGQGSGKGVFA
jgi:hypothetical protein